MREFPAALLLLVVLLGSSAAALALRPKLAEHHRSRETLDLIQLVTTMLVTFAAIVLGLLTSSAKASFDRVGADFRGLASDLIQLDQCLRDYGPATESARELLRSYTAAAIATTWPDEKAPEGNFYPRKLPRTESDTHLESAVLGAMLSDVGSKVRRLNPVDEPQQKLASDCLDRFEQLDQRRWKLIEDAYSSISMPFYLVLVFWLAVVFASLGISAPRNAVALVMLSLGAISISSSIYVIVDLDTPFTGLFSISSQPLRDALTHLIDPGVMLMER
ncbi:MAG: hypothetical protein JO227_23445 [Acetobacteraceae bacterium]|nr:hypothetical protein [Acetobacteraceae bacterium]